MTWKNVQYENGKYRTSSGGGGGASSLVDLDDTDINNPQNGQPLRYDETSQKWINGADNFPPLIYSAEEREVGVWTDGKPLYQRTFYGTTNANDNAVAVDTNAVWDIIECEGFIEESADKIQIGAYLNGSYYCGWYFDKYDNNTLKIFYSNQYKDKDYAITVKYTKSTDTPGSGTWTTQGGYAHHYDGNEKIIGTWFGDTLYEKTIYYQSPGGQADSDVIIDNTILHGTNCLVVDISGVQTYGYLDGSHPGAFSDPEPLSQNTLYLPFYGGATAPSGQIYLYSDGIHFMKKMAASNANGIILTVRYIKILS